MANKNGILKDENGNNLYPITLSSNVNGLDTLLLDKAAKDLSNTTNTELTNRLNNLPISTFQEIFKNFTATLTTGNVSGSGASYVIGTKGYWRLVTVWAYENAQRGTIEMYNTGTSGASGTLVSRSSGEDGYWQKQYLVVTALIPPNRYAYVTYAKVDTPKYSEQRIGG